MIKNDFGMPTLIENRTLKDNIGLCSELGLDFIELNMNFMEYQIDKLEDTDAFINPAKKAGIYYTIHLDETLNIADFNPLVRKAYLETVRRTIEVAKKFLILNEKFGRADNPPLIINMHMNHGIFVTLPDRKVQMYERDFLAYSSFFEEFRTLVDSWILGENIRINVENTDGFKSYEKKVLDVLLEDDNFGLTWDIGHSKAVKEIDVGYILEHENKLCHMHVHDGRENPSKNHLALGTGDIDINNRLKTAEAVHARCVLETKTIDALRTSVAWLRQ